MMPRSKEFLRTRDVDWGIRIGLHYIYVASAGGDIPEMIEDKLFDIWRVLKRSDALFREDEIQLNWHYLNEKFQKLTDLSYEERIFKTEWYVHSFKAMAMRGFYSFDRDIQSPYENSVYHWIARPRYNILSQELNLPTIKREIDPEEFEGKNIVALINQYWREEIQEHV